MKYSKEVKIEKVKESAGITSTRNPYAVDNVNQAQGPRAGSQGLNGKREAFKTAKEERAPLADTILGAFKMRGQMTNNESEPGLENISADTKAKFRKK